MRNGYTGEGGGGEEGHGDDWKDLADHMAALLGDLITSLSQDLDASLVSLHISSSIRALKFLSVVIVFIQ